MPDRVSVGQLGRGEPNDGQIRRADSSVQYHRFFRGRKVVSHPACFFSAPKGRIQNRPGLGLQTVTIHCV